MTYETIKFQVGDIEYDVIHCLGEGQCQCKRCKDRGIYNISWTSWFYKLNENDKGVICRHCLQELLIQKRIDAATKELKERLNLIHQTVQKIQTAEFETAKEKDAADSKQHCEKCRTYWLSKLDTQKARAAELQKQVDALETTNGQAMAYIEGLEYELKQVDELKEQRDVFKKLFESANTTSHFSTDIIIETMNSFYREQAEHLAGLKIEQAVKDTVKEILDKAIIIDKNTGNKGFICIEALTELCKSKGVEVE